MKRKYYLTGFAALIILILGYHFYAASRAEDQINKALTQLTEQQHSFSLQYSGLNIKPFRADLTIRDVTTVSGPHIIRLNSLTVDISYTALLRLYFFGTKNAIRHISPLSMGFINPSYNFSNNLGELKSDTMQVTYSGNLLDGLQRLQSDTTFAKKHKITFKMDGFSAVLPDTNRSSIKADQLQYQITFSPDRQLSLLNVGHQLSAQNIVWSPTSSLQQQYSFIIKGLGYPTDAIPFKSFKASISPTKKLQLTAIDWTLRSELALISSSGFLQTYRSIGNSEFQDTKITLTDLSPSFRQTLQNIEQLFSFSLPRVEENIELPVEGTLSNPSVSLKK